MSDLPILDERYKPQDGKRGPVDLDERLKKITTGVYRAGQGTFDEPLDAKAIKQIKQAFIDARWMPPTDIYTLSDQAAKSRHVATYGDKCFMTGQEWYDKFNKEIEENAELPNDQLYKALPESERPKYIAEFLYKQLDSAAKKAAGLK